MAKKLYDLCIKGREYTDKNGNTKNAWENIGSVMQGDKGPYMFLKRTFNPAGIDVEEGRESILVSMFEPKQNNSSNSYNDGNTYNDGSKGPAPAANDPRGNFKFADGPQGFGAGTDIPF